MPGSPGLLEQVKVTVDEMRERSVPAKLLITVWLKPGAANRLLHLFPK